MTESEEIEKPRETESKRVSLQRAARAILAGCAWSPPGQKEIGKTKTWHYTFVLVLKRASSF